MREERETRTRERDCRRGEGVREERETRTRKRLSEREEGKRWSKFERTSFGEACEQCSKKRFNYSRGSGAHNA